LLSGIPFQYPQPQGLFIWSSYHCNPWKKGVAEKQDELKRSFKHPAPFSSRDSATPEKEFGGELVAAEIHELKEPIILHDLS
jgi:hypothetical protein